MPVAMAWEESEGDVRYAADRKEKTRDRILGAAGRVFRRQGYHASGVDTVMAEAGLTAGGFYAHFDSKQALLAEAHRACGGGDGRAPGRLDQESVRMRVGRSVPGSLSQSGALPRDRGRVSACGPGLGGRTGGRVGEATVSRRSCRG